MWHFTFVLLFNLQKNWTIKKQQTYQEYPLRQDRNCDLYGIGWKRAWNFIKLQYRFPKVLRVQVQVHVKLGNGVKAQNIYMAFRYTISTTIIKKTAFKQKLDRYTQKIHMWPYTAMLYSYAAAATSPTAKKQKHTVLFPATNQLFEESKMREININFILHSNTHRYISISRANVQAQ